jgi:hypothetical protein
MLPIVPTPSTPTSYTAVTSLTAGWNLPSRIVYLVEFSSSKIHVTCQVSFLLALKRRETLAYIKKANISTDALPFTPLPLRMRCV